MTPQQADVLDFERRWYALQSNKETDIGHRLRISAVRYYQILAALLDDPDALATDPVLVNRLRRIRDSRATQRRAG